MRRIRRGVILVLVLLLGFCAGCQPTGGLLFLIADGYLSGGVVGYLLGYLQGAASANFVVKQECFKNGVPIDCADIPQG
jgi:hypothetical protein